MSPGRSVHSSGGSNASASRPLRVNNGEEHLHRFNILLTTVIQPDDNIWDFSGVQLPHLPRGKCPQTASGEVKVWLKSIQVTSQWIRLSFEKQSMNRVLATSVDNNDKFILISFANFRFEESPPKITSQYIERMLKTGTKINGTKYIFYGHSNSQLKSKTCYLYSAPSSSYIMKQISSYGDFSKFNSVAKRAKRIGLLFSAVSSTIELDPKKTKDIEDVEENGFNFTDGCGSCSKDFANILAKKGNIIFHNRRYTPSAFQIRYKGYKGMLVLNPSLPPGDYAHFRSSMLKFKGCPDNTFAVINYSKPFTYGYLNGEFVTLLSALGIKDEVFLKKQNEYFNFLREASSSSTSNPFLAFQLLCFKSEFDLAEQILLQGLTPQLLSSVKKHAKEEWAGTYKTKAKGAEQTQEERVRICISQSRILYGVCDYTGTLKEGECHTRITSETDGPLTLDGAEIIVSRNPCLHPGDVRKFKAVRNEALHHLVDCIVFPIVGRRDPAGLMSGGDLDGDTFFVCWDKDLIPKVMFEPYGYPPAKEVLVREIGHDQMIEYFAKFNNASLGKVKNLYLEWAAIGSAGSSQCQELNKLFSSCVDGEPVKIPDHLSTPPKKEGVFENTWILDKLIGNVKKHRQTIFQEEAAYNFKDLPTDEQINEILISTELCFMDEFELFQLVLQYCKKTRKLIDDFLCYFDFGKFTSQQKYLVLSSLDGQKNRSLRAQYMGPIFNGLHQSRLLSIHQIIEANLHLPAIRWQMLYSSEFDDGKRILSSLERAMEDFDKKLVVARVDEQLIVAIYIPSRVEKGKEVDFGGLGNVRQPKNKNTPKSKSKRYQTIKLFAWDPLSRTYYKRTTHKDYKLMFDGEIIQIYEKKATQTFIWFALNERYDQRNKISRNKQDDSWGHYKFSIALQKFDQRLSQAHARVQKQLDSNLEIYVISNRDRIGHDILDITMNQVDTLEERQILENIPKDYQLPVETEMEFDFKNREFCEEIILTRQPSVSFIEKLNRLEFSEFEQILRICLVGNRSRLMEIFNVLFVDHVGHHLARMIVSHQELELLRDCLDIEPSISLSIIAALAFKTHRSEHEEQFKVYSPLSLFPLLFKSLLITTNSMPEICRQRFKDMMNWILNQKTSLGLAALIENVKRILFTVRHSDLAEDFIRTLFEEQYHPLYSSVYGSTSSAGGDQQGLKPQELKYALHSVIALAMDYLGEVVENCKIDFRGIPQGAEKLCDKKNPSPINENGKPLLSDFFRNKDSRTSPNPISPQLWPNPDQLNIEVKHSLEEERLYETILRTDVKCNLRQEDHVRFCAGKKAASASARDHITVFDAIIKKISRGKMEFHIMQIEPPELTKCSWNIYRCATTTNFNTQLTSLQKLMEQKTVSSVAYYDIVGIRQDSSEERCKSQEGMDKMLIPLPAWKFNQSQENAIRKAVNGPTTLVWGPPGTGKTAVVVEIILQFLKIYNRVRILITASTHNAVDNVLERFLEARKEANIGDIESTDVIRLTSEVSNVSNSKLKKWTLDAFIGKDMHNSDKAKGEAKKKLSEARLVFSTCSGAGVGLMREKKIQQIDNITGDNSTCRQPKKKKLKPQNAQKFDVVIIDEASQITEPNALTPLVKNSKFVILVGDHVQLCPTVTELGKKFGVEKSLFEKLYTSSTTSCFKVMLDTQYRMHPQLVIYPSEQFYDGKLCSGVERTARIMPPSLFPWPEENGKVFPCVFVHCPTLESNPGSSSKINKGQVECTYDVIRLLKSPGTRDEDLNCKGKEVSLSISVLTPYGKQKEAIIQGLKSFGTSIQVNTIDGFQGRESDIIIFVTVRANPHNNLGFMQDPRRINVALTRAKYGLIIIGHEGTLKGNSLTKEMISDKFCKTIDIRQSMLSKTSAKPKIKG